MNHSGDKLIAFFKDAAAKLEELQVQAALGKAEFSDQLEELKKEAKHKIAELKANANAGMDRNRSRYEDLKAKIEHLEVQLALGKAETKEELHEQKKKLEQAIRDVKNMLKES